jgi:hypothetical protein
VDQWIPANKLTNGEHLKTANGATATVIGGSVPPDSDGWMWDLTIPGTKTTSNHLFWDATTSRWIKAAALKYGTHLRTPTGRMATALGGSTPNATTGWMWDLSVPGNNDHDFYIDTGVADILVHNCSGGVYTLRDPETGEVVRTGRTGNLAVRQAQLARDPDLSDFEFQVEYRTDNYAEQRGLEQVLYDRYPGAQEASGGFNKIRAISMTNSRRSGYMEAAADYLGGG